ncbi:hypothetical protein [Poriferisphaera corsica]|nr:hypothetical protein [Poriferisphaera corsica]
MGKELGCKCGHDFRPVTPQVVDPHAATGGVETSTQFGLYAQASGGKSAVARALEERVDDITPSKVKAWYIPLVCIPIGWLVTIGLMIFLTGDPSKGSFIAVEVIMIQMIVFIPTAIWALLFVADWFDLAFSDFKTTLLKIAALTFLPAAICDVLLVQIMAIAGFDHWYLVACLAPYLFLCGVPVGLMFAMQLNEASIFLVLLFIPRAAAYFGLATIFPDYFQNIF